MSMYADCDKDIREMAERIASDFSWDNNILAGAIAGCLSIEREKVSALMTERTSLIATKREQLDALTAERDMWRAQALRGAQ